MGVFLAQLRYGNSYDGCVELSLVPLSLPHPHMCPLTLMHTCICIRLMLGVQSSSAPPGFLVEPCGSAGLADWELDRLMWSRTVENVATATTTITSLAQLLDQIGNIVITDNIASQVI